MICSETVKFILNNIISDSQLTNTADLRADQVVEPVDQRDLHFQDHCPNAKTISHYVDTQL